MAPDRMDSRKALRMAREALQGKRDPAKLEEAGIHIGESVQIDPKAFLAEAGDSDAPAMPELHIYFYEGDLPSADMGEVEDALVHALAEAGVGEWVESGSGKLGDKPPFEVIMFEITDEPKALAVARRTLLALKAGNSTELRVGDRIYHLLDE